MTGAWSLETLVISQLDTSTASVFAFPKISIGNYILLTVTFLYTFLVIHAELRMYENERRLGRCLFLAPRVPRLPHSEIDVRLDLDNTRSMITQPSEKGGTMGEDRWNN